MLGFHSAIWRPMWTGGLTEFPFAAVWRALVPILSRKVGVITRQPARQLPGLFS